MNFVPALEFKNVCFQYPSDAAPVIDHLNFQVQKGEFVSIIGPSGCGKSTIFRLVNRLLTQTKGEILIDGVDLKGRKGYCGYMPQKDLMFPWRTVEENVCMPLEIKGGFTKKEREIRVLEALKSVGLFSAAKKSPWELSGGMRQRAAFARTLLTGAELLLLDEPFSALDYLTRLSMREWLLAQWKREKKTVLFITHDVEEAVFLSTRILLAESSPICNFRVFSVPQYGEEMKRVETEEKRKLKYELISLLQKAGAE